MLLGVGWNKSESCNEIKKYTKLIEYNDKTERQPNIQLRS